MTHASDILARTNIRSAGIGGKEQKKRDREREQRNSETKETARKEESKKGIEEESERGEKEKRAAEARLGPQLSIHLRMAVLAAYVGVLSWKVPA